MNTICISDKKGNMIAKLITYDKKVFDLLFKKLKKDKHLNVYEEKKGEQTMFDIVDLMIHEFLNYLPSWTLIFLVLGIVGSLVFGKK